jgi:phospholipase D1/2
MNQIIIETQNSIQQPYSNVYNSDSFQIDLNDPLREFLFFLPDHSIQIQIIDHEVEPAIVNLLHTNVYTISVKHAQFSWTIKRKYKNFLKLYEAYALFKTKLNIRNATHTNNNLPQVTNPTPNETTTAAASSNANRFKSSDHFKLFFQSIASDFTHSKHILEKFLQDVVDNKIFRNHNETVSIYLLFLHLILSINYDFFNKNKLKFLEVSHLSFVSELGDKNKEGLIKKHAFSIRFCSSASSGLNYFCATRWLIIKDTWIAYLEPKTGEIRTVMLVDKLFRVQSGLAGTGERSGLLIENLSKNLFVKCYNEKRANEWRYAIQYMLDTTGKEFCSLQPARFEAFAPVRYGCKTRWFVDGADYMESIADSIQSATEEIFITGFFLSPEIYLKR